MNAPAFSTQRLGRLSSWFAPGAAAAQRDTAEPATRNLVDRRLYEDVGDFLFTHGLSPTPINFEIAHIYLSGSDPSVARAVADLIARHGRLDHSLIAALAEQVRPRRSVSDALALLADKLEARLVECLSAADRSHSSARDYGNALDVAQTQLASDPTGTLEYIAGLTREVVTTTRMVETELKQTRRETDKLRGDLDKAREAAECDHLTGLPNRRGLERRIAALIADREARDPTRRVAVALCDIDDFKLVNDVHGHQAGDRVLKFFGNFLASELGVDACVARYGGEEFAVLIEGQSPHEAMMLLDDVRERLSRRSLVNQDSGQPIGRITFSAGIAALAHDGPQALNAADVALYQAKRGGKNAVVVAPAKAR
ncbi:MAG: GGDEF domain-containing protein [Pseudomonadota bacterium]